MASSPRSHTPPPVVSTGRGGQGNIGPDPTIYTDGGIVREGVVGQSDRNEYSTGRGGAGNIATPVLDPQKDDPVYRASVELVPDVSVVSPRRSIEAFHVGRGGGGNIHHVTSNSRERSKHPTVPAPGRLPGDHHKGSLGSRIKEKLGLAGHSSKAEGEK